MRKEPGRDRACIAERVRAPTGWAVASAATGKPRLPCASARFVRSSDRSSDSRTSLFGQSNQISVNAPERRAPVLNFPCVLLDVRRATHQRILPTAAHCLLSKHRTQTQPAMTQKALGMPPGIKHVRRATWGEATSGAQASHADLSVNQRNSRHWSQVASELATSQSEYGRTPSLGDSELSVKAARISRTKCKR